TERRNLEKSRWSARSSRQAITKGATRLQLAWRLDFTRIYSLFADLDPPQNFALRSDESSVNERQMCGDLGERCKRSQRLQLDLACGPRWIANVPGRAA